MPSPASHDIFAIELERLRNLMTLDKEAGCTGPALGQWVKMQQDAARQQDEERENQRKPREAERKEKEAERKEREEERKHELALIDEEITLQVSRRTPTVPHSPAASFQPLTISPPASSISEVSQPVNPGLVPEGNSKEDSLTSSPQITAREDSSHVPERTASLGDSAASQSVVPSRLHHPVPRMKFWNKFCQDCGRKGHMSANYGGCANHNIPTIGMALPIHLR
ncbi:caldesmon, smooth muscle-like [Macrobrachium nipponense]|uniref:caldesmon, smooth muscle-like n=1 Tax=Macrobrachium nipponense TaxID=159736 RepID=UPI0030C7B186